MEGIITSPEYPDNYPANKSCTSRIEIPEGYIIGLSIQYNGIIDADFLKISVSTLVAVITILLT